MIKNIGTLALLSCISLAYASESKVETILSDYMKAWEEHNITKIDSYYAQDVAWYDLPSDSITKGRANVSKAIT